MLYRCDKCGATTRWYDEKCPRCGTALTVEIPTIPIVLPNFESSPSRRDDATISLTTEAQSETARLETNQTKDETKDETTRRQTNETPNEAARLETNEAKDETPRRQTNEAKDETTRQETNETLNEAARLETNEAKDETARQETNETPNEAARLETNETKDETTRQETSETPNEAKDETPRQETNETPNEASPTRSQRFLAFRRVVDAWRAAFAPETSSVTLPRGRAARYALGIVFELIVCPPCAILAAYFFTRAIFADRRAQYHSAIQETEKARRTLGVGLGVFAAFLCAFMLYVRSHEARLPTETGPTSRFFKN